MNKLLLTISLGLLVFIVGCNVESTSNNDSDFNNIPAKEAYVLIQDENIVVLDVRTDEEFALGHIDGSVNIDFYNPNFKNMINSLDKDKTYVVYCRSGRRSGNTMNTMKELGFKKAYNVVGGVNSWQENNLPLVK